MPDEKRPSPGMTNKATHADAEIILRLYEMRREPIMREAREFITFKFWPADFEEFQKLFIAGGKEFAYFRQVTSYWDMAISFVARGALDSNLFFDNCNEMFFLYGKFKQFLPQLRQQMSPQFWRRVEEFVLGSPESLEKLRNIELSVERLREKARAARA